MNIDSKIILELSKKAGKAILEIYNNPSQSDVVDYKADDSPLTLADKASHNVIVDGLMKHFPNIPIISEEGQVPEYDVRRDYDRYWLIDPLDGTKEFINKNGQFTVNIALISKNKPVFGVVYKPVTDELYIGDSEQGAYKYEGLNKRKIEVNNSISNRIAVRSKSHASPEEDDVLKQFDVTDSISVGSSLKFCMVAEGKADVYYRHGPTMEWDTAAGHAVVEAAGGNVYIGTGAKPFVYNKENLLNGSFLCLGFSRDN